MKILLYTLSSALASEWKSKLKEHSVLIISSQFLILQKVDTEDIDLVCIDINSNAKETITDILSLKPDMKILLLSREPNFIEGREFLALGIKGYANAHMQDVHFSDAVKSIKNGNVWLYPEFIQSMILLMTKEASAPKDIQVLEKLTSKERDVANLIYKGLTNQEIAEVSGITLRTVKAHVSAIFEKTGAKDRIHLILLMRNL